MRRGRGQRTRELDQVSYDTGIRNTSFCSSSPIHAGLGGVAFSVMNPPDTREKNYTLGENVSPAKVERILLETFQLLRIRVLSGANHFDERSKLNSIATTTKTETSFVPRQQS
jgi:hypothetical protein